MFHLQDSVRSPEADAFRSLWHDAVGRGSGAGAVSEQTLKLLTSVSKRHLNH